MIQQQRPPQQTAITFDMILDDFLSNQQKQLNVVRFLIKDVKGKNNEISNLRKQLEEAAFVPDKDNEDDEE